MLNDFKAFLMRGNVMDLAVAVIIGTAFGKIISSLVADVLMPAIGILIGGVNFVGEQVKIGGTDAEPVYLMYGNFVQAAIDFIIIAAVIFLMVRMLSKLQKPAEATAKPCPRCRMNVALTATRCPHCTSELSA